LLFGDFEHHLRLIVCLLLFFIVLVIESEGVQTDVSLVIVEHILRIFEGRMADDVYVALLVLVHLFVPHFHLDECFIFLVLLRYLSACLNFRLRFAHIIFQLPPSPHYECHSQYDSEHDPPPQNNLIRWFFCLFFR